MARVISLVGWAPPDARLYSPALQGITKCRVSGGEANNPDEAEAALSFGKICRGVQIFWGVEMTYTSPYLLSLGLSSHVARAPCGTTLWHGCAAADWRAGGQQHIALGPPPAVHARAVAATVTTWGSPANDRLTVALAVLSIFIIDFTVNAGGGQRARSAHARHGSSLEALAPLVSLLLLACHLVTALLVRVRVLLGGSANINPSLLTTLRDIWSNACTLQGSSPSMRAPSSLAFRIEGGSSSLFPGLGVGAGNTTLPDTRLLARDPRRASTARRSSTCSPLGGHTQPMPSGALAATPTPRAQVGRYAPAATGPPKHFRCPRRLLAGLGAFPLLVTADALPLRVCGRRRGIALPLLFDALLLTLLDVTLLLLLDGDADCAVAWPVLCVFGWGGIGIVKRRVDGCKVGVVCIARQS
ncbi:hypothetical protein C8J57DRAFT_1473955 [Mycena rebaudengoi]|nr:hypothetical protein C8J57DRAFT_1473955 [Mycena rebaudengoi]